MKKWIILLLPLLLLGCTIKKTEKVISKIEANENRVLAIHYPETPYPKLNQILKKEMNKIQTEFEKKYQSSAELNISYNMEIQNKRYYNIVVSIFINDSTLTHPIKEIKTYVFDSYESKLLKLEDIIAKETLKKVKTRVQRILLEEKKECLILSNMQKVINDNFEKNARFAIQDNTLTIYFNPYEVTSYSCGIIKIKLNNIPFRIPLEKEIVKEKEFPLPKKDTKEIDPNKPVIAFTFDDGPSKYTKEILDLLKQYHAHATFFVIGNKVESYQEIIYEMIEEGHEIGNHSYTHKNLSKVSKEEFLNELNKTQEVLKKVANYTPKIFRPTYGSKTKKMQKETNLKLVLWDLDPRDWDKKRSEDIAEHILTNIKNRDIIILHDTKKKTVEALKIVLPKLQEEGYHFITVSELQEVLK